MCQLQVFGVPTIRTDLPHPKAETGRRQGRSIADNNNYGNEPAASHLLNPGIGADRGVTEEQYVHLRGREEIRELVDIAGVEFAGEAEFDAAFDMAASICGATDMCSVETLLHAKQHILRSAAGLQ